MSDLKKIVSASAVAYAVANIAPVIEKLNTLSENSTSQNKLLSYHVFETCLLAQGEKVTHAMLEQAVNMPFDKRVSAKGRKVADYVMNKKPSKNGLVYTASQFRAVTEGETVAPAELHVMTVYGHIAAYEKEQRETRADTLSVVEQSLEAKGLPVVMAASMIKQSQAGDDSALTFCKDAIANFTPVTKEKAAPSVDVLQAALDMLVTMDPSKAGAWIEQAAEMLGYGVADMPESELAQVA